MKTWNKLFNPKLANSYGNAQKLKFLANRFGQKD